MVSSSGPITAPFVDLHVCVEFPPADAAAAPVEEEQDRAGQAQTEP